MRADKIGDEAGFQFTFLGSGNEYQRAKEIKSTNGNLILPLEYPKAYQVNDALDVDAADVAVLKTLKNAVPIMQFFSQKKVFHFLSR